MRIDAHQHFWKYDSAQYPWIPRKSPLERDWLPSDWQEQASPAGMEGSIAVQARQTVEESRWLLHLADHFSAIKGVVGWVDLRSNEVERQLADLSRHAKFVGVRHVVQDEPDDRFMLQSDFLGGIARLSEFELVYDLLLFPKQLPAAIELTRRFPEQPFVLDHIAKPNIRDRTFSPWRENIRELAQAPNVLCKASGMVTEALPGRWKQEDFRPYLDIVFEAFGEERIMFGSDWPVCLLSAGYREVFATLEDYLKQFTSTVRAKVLGETAAKFYGVS